MFKSKVFKSNSERFQVTIKDETFAVIDIPVPHSFSYDKLIVELCNRTHENPHWVFSFGTRILFTMPAVWGPKEILKKIDAGHWFNDNVNFSKLVNSLICAKMAIKRINVHILNPDKFFLCQNEDLSWKVYEVIDGNCIDFELGLRPSPDAQPNDICDFILHTFNRQGVKVEMAYQNGAIREDFHYI